jgi:hypothetical protein
MDTVNCAPFERVVLFDPAHAGSAVSSAPRARAVARRLGLDVLTRLLIEVPP